MFATNTNVVEYPFVVCAVTRHEQCKFYIDTGNTYQYKIFAISCLFWHSSKSKHKKLFQPDKKFINTSIFFKKAFQLKANCPIANRCFVQLKWGWGGSYPMMHRGTIMWCNRTQWSCTVVQWNQTLLNGSTKTTETWITFQQTMCADVNQDLNRSWCEFLKL